MKKSKKSLMLLPLLAICLSGCYTIIPEDTPEVNEDEFTPEGSYTIPEEDTSESTGGDNTSSPSETPGGDSSSSPSETPGGDSSSDSGKPSEPSDPTNPSEPEPDIITYELKITNKEELELGISNSFDDPNDQTYTLEVCLYKYTNGVDDGYQELASTDVNTDSTNPASISLSGLDLVLGTQSGVATLTVSWKEDSSVSDSVTLYYSYTEHVIDYTYTYTLEIVNKSELTASNWLICDNPRVVEVKVTKYTYADGECDGGVELAEPNVTLYSENDNVTIDGLNVSPAHLGSDIIYAYFEEGEYTASDYFEILIEDYIYDYGYSLTINNAEDFISTIDSADPWRVGEAKTIHISLNSKKYMTSTDTSEDNETIQGTGANVKIYVYKQTDGGYELVTGTTNDIYYLATTEEITLIPQDIAAGNTYTVVAVWDGYEEAYQAITSIYIGEKLTASYSLVIDDDSIFNDTWYLDEENTKTFTYKIYETYNGESSLYTLSSDEISNMVTTSSNGQVATAVINEDGSVTVTALGTGTCSIYVYWSTHNEAVNHVDVSIAEPNYQVSVTPPEEGFGTEDSPWRIEQGDRSFTVATSRNDVEYQNPQYLSVAASIDGLVSINQSSTTFTLSPLQKGSTLITVYWKDGDDAEANTLASTSFMVYISDEVKVTGIEIEGDKEINIDKDESVTLKATITPDNATNKTVTWESSNTDDFSLTPDGLNATVVGTNYEATTTVTVTSEDGGYTDSITIKVNEKGNSAAKVITEKLDASPISNPDDNGVYVVGTSNGSSYLDSNLTITKEYNSAAPVRVEAAEGGYYLSINDSYLTSGGTLDESINNAKIFTLVDGALDSLYIASGGITATGGNEQAYLLNATYTEGSKSTLQGSYYLGCKSGSKTLYFNGTLSGKMSTTSNILEAAKVTVSNEGGNAYYMSYMDGSTQKYIHLTSSSNTDLSTSGQSYIYYDDTNDIWVDSIADATRYLGLNGTSIGQYTISNHTNGTYPDAVLYDVEQVDVKGVAISMLDDTCMVGFSIEIGVNTYPSIAGELVDSDLTYSTTSLGGSLTISGSTIIGESAGDATLSATYTNASGTSAASNTLTITIENSSVEMEEQFLGTYDFSKNTSSNTSQFTTGTSGTGYSYFNGCWDQGDGLLVSSPLTDVTNTTKTYNGGGGSNGIAGSNLVMKFGSGSSKTDGNITLEFGNYKITKVVIQAAGYNGSGNNYAIGVDSQTAQITENGANISEGDIAATASYTFDIAGGESTVDINNGGLYRVLVVSIAIYAMVVVS